jgi:tetratricopeptide (TPR) repeat protein
MPLPLSICMIVRDEAANLAGALASVRDVAAELVVVDTGSTDRTVAIAQAAGARVLNAAWHDDFSAARNVALDAASQDWILTLDADQRLDATTLPALAAALARPALAHLVTIRMVADATATAALGHYTALRLFRRDPRIRYRGRVHEDVADALLAIGSDAWSDAGVVLRDFGYGDAAERQRKRERNLLLLERAHAEQPDDLFVAYKLAITLPPARADARAQLLQDAIASARLRAGAGLEGQTFLPRLLALAVDALVAQGRLDEAADAAQALAPVLGGSAWFTAGRARARTGDPTGAQALLLRFLEVGPTHAHPAVLPDPGATPTEACLWLARLRREAGDLEAARRWLRQARSGASAAQQVTIQCENLRIDLAAGTLEGLAGSLGRLHCSAQASATARAEALLVSAEVTAALGDAAGALQLAEAAVVPEDDRAAALVVRLELQRGIATPTRLQGLAQRIAGRTHDTLALRQCVLAQFGGAPDPAAAAQVAVSVAG